LAIDQNIISYLKQGRFIRAGAPNVIVGNNRFAGLTLVLIVQRGLALSARFHRLWSVRENCASLYGRTAVCDGDVGDANSLHHAGFLAGPNWLDCQRRLLRKRMACTSRA